MAVKFALTFAQIMLAAREEARHLNQSYVGVEHLFMALCRLNGFTVNLLRRKGLDPRTVRRTILHTLPLTATKTMATEWPYQPNHRAIPEIYFKSGAG